MSIDLALLRDPVAFARARVEQEAAERRAGEEAAAARARAKAEAVAAAEAALQAEVDSLVGPREPVEAAEVALQEVLDRQAANAAAIQEAEKALAQARAVLPSLVDRAVTGKQVALGEIEKAHAGVAAAEHRLTFLGVVAGRFPPLIAEAEKVVKAAIAVAHEPVLERGIDLRIEAAVLADIGRGIDGAGNFTGLTDGEARDRAWEVFQRANRLLHYAARKGVRIPGDAGISEQGPGRPHIERRRWNRAAPAPEDVA